VVAVELAWVAVALGAGEEMAFGTFQVIVEDARNSQCIAATQPEN